MRKKPPPPVARPAFSKASGLQSSFSLATYGQLISLHLCLQEEGKLSDQIFSYAHHLSRVTFSLLNPYAANKAVKLTLIERHITGTMKSDYAIALSINGESEGADYELRGVVHKKEADRRIPAEVIAALRERIAVQDAKYMYPDPLPARETATVLDLVAYRAARKPV